MSASSSPLVTVPWSVVMNDKGYTIYITINQKTGGVKDLTGYTGATLKIWAPGAITNYLTASMTIVSPPTLGQVSYTVTATDFPTVGAYKWIVTLLSGVTVKESTLPQWMTVLETAPV